MWLYTYVRVGIRVADKHIRYIQMLEYKTWERKLQFITQKTVESRVTGVLRMSMHIMQNKSESFCHQIN